MGGSEGGPLGRRASIDMLSDCTSEPEFVQLPLHHSLLITTTACSPIPNWFRFALKLTPKCKASMYGFLDPALFRPVCQLFGP